MKAWKIRYAIRDTYDDILDRVAYLQSDTPPTAEERLRCILQEQCIQDDDPMEHYDDLNWVYAWDGNDIEITYCEQVPPQRLIRVWHEAAGVYVGDHDWVLQRFPVSDDGHDLMQDLAYLLRSLGYIVSLQTGHQRWVD